MKQNIREIICDKESMPANFNSHNNSNRRPSYTREDFELPEFLRSAFTKYITTGGLYNSGLVQFSCDETITIRSFEDAASKSLVVDYDALNGLKDVPSVDNIGLVDDRFMINFKLELVKDCIVEGVFDSGSAVNLFKEYEKLGSLVGVETVCFTAIKALGVFRLPVLYTNNIKMCISNISRQPRMCSCNIPIDQILFGKLINWKTYHRDIVDVRITYPDLFESVMTSYDLPDSNIRTSNLERLGIFERFSGPNLVGIPLIRQGGSFTIRTVNNNLKLFIEE